MSPPPFEVRALIEGFYGVYYTHPERLSLLRFLGRHDYNLYVYAPKNDRQHRSRWREPYPERQMEQFSEARACAAESGLEFCYALSPGVDSVYASESDFESITAKLAQFLQLGVTSFSLLLDDIRREFSDARDAESYPSFAAAQADLCNRVHAWLRRQDDRCRLSMCPTDYHGRPPFSPALHELGTCLHPDIDVFYTGVDVCSPTVTRSEVDAFAAALARKPILWDNYPVNDLEMHGELHIGPVRGRSADLAEALRGFAVNPMIQPEASRVALATFADYFRDPVRYDAESSWDRALSELAGEHHQQLRLVAENSLQSCLGTPEAERLERLTGAAADALMGERATDPAADQAADPAADQIAELTAYLRELDEACYSLRYRMANLELRNELLPWLEQLERWSWLGRWSVEVLQPAAGRRSPAARTTATAATALASSPDSATLRRIEEYIQLVDNHPKRIGGTSLRRLAELAVERFETAAVA
ncbi:MAG: protein O-GlcNAcase [Trueperaceae bacterium]